LKNSDQGLSQILGKYMSKTSGLGDHCYRCLETKRWNASAVLMVVDAAFTSIGLNYFNAVVPSVVKFEQEFIVNGKIGSLRDLSTLKQDRVVSIWRNTRSWKVAKGVACYLHSLAAAHSLDDRGALRRWAANSRPEDWREDPIGRINGVGITTFQYLRMMGGIDTAMPDKIVRRVVKQILEEAGVDMPVEEDMELISTIELMARLSGYRLIEICWMTWMIQSEGDMTRMEKYRDLLDKI
jgi:hypothetical protein